MTTSKMENEGLGTPADRETTTTTPLMHAVYVTKNSKSAELISKK